MKWTFRNITAFMYASFLILSGKVRKACRDAKNGEFILSIYFHNPSKTEFESIVKWLIKKDFHFISIAEFRKIIHKELPFPKGAVLITVDDGWASNRFTIVEVANAYKIPVAIFVSTEPVEKGAFWWSYVREGKKRNMDLPSLEELKKVTNKQRLSVVNQIKDKINLSREAMTTDQLQTISKSRYITIGGHTHTHPLLIHCRDEEVKQELQLSKQKLESWLGKEIDIFAYPNGDYGKREINILKELNYNLGFANNPRYYTKNDLNHCYSIPRFGFLEGASFAENICRVVGIWKKKVKEEVSEDDV